MQILSVVAFSLVLLTVLVIAVFTCSQVISAIKTKSIINMLLAVVGITALTLNSSLIYIFYDLMWRTL